MVRPRRLLLGMTLATTLGVSAHAAEPDATIDSVANLLSGSTVTCSAALPSGTMACWWERRVLTLGDVEVAVALDAALVASTGAWYVTPMASVAWYGPTASVWGEVALPADVLGIPRLGRSDWLRIGLSWTIP